MAGAPSRRRFLAQTGAAATALWLPGYVWAQKEEPDELKFPDVSELVKHLPPRARYVPKPVPDAENGYLAYQEAFDAVVGTDKLIPDLTAALGDDASIAKYDGLIASEDATFPQGREGEILEHWTGENQRSHDLLVKASRFSRGFISSTTLENGFVEMYSGTPMEYFRAKHGLSIAEELRVLRALRDEDVSGAINSTLAMSRLHRMLVTATGPIMTALEAITKARLARRWMRILARRASTGPDDVNRLRDELSRYDQSRNWFADTLRAELHVFWLPLIKYLQDAKTLPQVADVLIRFRGDWPVTTDQDKGEETIRTLTKELLEGHPRPFDALATVKMLGQSLADYTSGLSGPQLPTWTEVPAEVKRENSLWPREFTDELRLLVYNVEFEANGNRELPLTRERKRAVREELRKVKNPLGKLLFLGSNADFFSPAIKSFETDHRLTQVVLAGRIFWGRHHRVPGSLDELVDEGLMEQVPADPFAEGALKYDAERATVWSVAHNGKDDRGESFDVFKDDPNDTRDDLATPMPRF